MLYDDTLGVLDNGAESALRALATMSRFHHTLRFLIGHVNVGTAVILCLLIPILLVSDASDAFQFSQMRQCT